MLHINEKFAKLPTKRGDNGKPTLQGEAYVQQFGCYDDDDAIVIIGFVIPALAAPA